MMRPGASLFWKFFLSILLAQLAAAVGIGSVFWLREQARLAHTSSIETGPPAAFMLDSAAVALKYGGLPALREILGQPNRHTVYVLDGAGHELLGRAVAPAVRAQAQRELAAERPFQPVRMLSAPEGGQWLAFVPRQFDAPLDLARTLAPQDAALAPLGPGPGPAHPDAAPPPGDAHERAPGPGLNPGTGRFGPGWQLVRPVPLLASIIVSLLFAALLAWYVARPIRALRSAFEAAAGGDLAPRFTHHAARGGDELAELGRDFDRMSSQLRALMDGQRRLLHHVSHELRSPLARLQAAIGLAHQQPENIATSLARIEREGGRMDKLVGELLTLSRLEVRAALPPVEPVDMQELVEGIVSDARFEAAAQGVQGAQITLHCQPRLTAHLRGAPDLLWSACENVVRNALKHGAGAALEVRLHSDARWLNIEVLDRGPGIAPEHLASIFQPFFRADPAHNNVDGHGLGLAIAERVVQAHGGSIVASNRSKGGLRIVLTLPLAP